VTVLGVPYHLDEYLPELDLPLPADETITAELDGGDVWARLAVLYRTVAVRVAEASSEAAGPGGPPVVLSGDCLTALGTMAGLQRAGVDAGIVWFDAHGDVQTPETTASGYIGGYPLRLLVGYRPELIAARLGVRAVTERRVILVDARDLDPPEAEYLAGAAIVRAEVTSLDPAALPDGPLYVHVAIDVLDPAQLPGLRFPAPGGPATADVTRAVGAILATGRVAALGIACTWRALGAAPRPASGHIWKPRLPDGRLSG
jgi:arginase